MLWQTSLDLKWQLVGRTYSSRKWHAGGGEFFLSTRQEIYVHISHVNLISFLRPNKSEIEVYSEAMTAYGQKNLHCQQAHCALTFFLTIWQIVYRHLPTAYTLTHIQTHSKSIDWHVTVCACGMWGTSILIQSRPRLQRAAGHLNRMQS